MSPRKVRVVANAVMGSKVATAMDQLTFSKRAAAKPLATLLKSAIVNASKENGVDIDNLYVKKFHVDAGPSMKRSLPRARGMATPILKRVSHVTVELDEKKENSSK